MSLPAGWIRVDGVTSPRGGQAEVFCVVRSGRPERYALKRLADKGRAARFEREVDTMRRLASSDLGVVPPIVDTGVDPKGRPFYVLPWYAEGSLQDVVDRGGLESQVDALLLLNRVAAGLELAHEAGIAHRDVKPGNVLLDDDRRPLLADFGLCLEVPDVVAAGTATSSRLTESARAIGSRLYIAPENEVGFNPDVDHRPADFWAYAKMIWVVMTGRPPRSASDQLSPGNRLAELVHEGLVGVDALCEQLLIRDPRARLTDWNAVHEEITASARRLAGTDQVAVHPDESAEAALDAARRFRSLPGVTALSLRRDAERIAKDRLSDLSAALSRGAHLHNEALDALSNELGDMGRVSIAGGGPDLHDVAAFGVFETAGVDAATAQSMERSELAGSEHAAVMVTVTVDDNSVPYGALGLWVLLRGHQAHVVQVPYLFSHERGQPKLRVLPVLAEAFGVAYEPLRVGLVSSVESGERIGARLGECSFRFVTAYLRVIGDGLDVRDPLAWSSLLGIPLGADRRPVSETAWRTASPPPPALDTSN